MSSNKKQPKVDLLTEKMLEFRNMQKPIEETEEDLLQESDDEEKPKEKKKVKFMRKRQNKKQWEIVDNLYLKETRILDHNLNALHDFIKPQAKSIYYDRKVEYINMVHEKQKYD